MNAVPAVCAVTAPELPLPAVKVWPSKVTTSLLILPATSVSVPKFVVPFVTPTIADVPVFVILPVAKGVPAVGRTRTFCQVRLDLPLPVSAAVTVNVSCVEETDVIGKVIVAGVSTPLMALLLPAGLLPAIRLTKTVGAVPQETT